ncbi:anti-sigma factor [Luteipulveratus mongoliensis]|uniref:anti-sigma factor n=1 Tax=Luteipulveratus mongoliensis TaxID=571913 RepID=UPI0006992279|nr:anti-sigma factor [Luteipulveratus mongoliensis]
MNDDLHELAAAYALDAVDDIERAAFERHLRTCARCQEEVASYDDVVLALADSAPAVTPAPSLKSSLMDQIEAEPQIAARHRATVSLEAAPRHEAPTRHQSWLSRSRILVAAAAVALLAVVGVAATQPWEQPTSVASISPAQRVMLAQDAQQRVATIGQARLVVTTSRSEGASAVQTERMPAAPAGHAYQAWFLDQSGAPRSAGLMSGAEPQLLTGKPGSTLAVTVEPAGGSAAPTTTPLVEVSLV